MAEQDGELGSSAAEPGWLGDVRRPPEVGASPETVAAIHRDAFAGLALAGHPFAVQPIVVPETSYRELLSATEALLRLLSRAAQEIAPDRAGRMRALSITEQDCPAFGDDEDYELRHWADMARPDVVVGPDGPRFVEFNVSGCFEGMVDFQAHLDTWQRVRGEAGLPAFVVASPFPDFAALIRRVCGELGVPPAVVFAGTRRMQGARISEFYYRRKNALLRACGIRAEQLEFEELRAGLEAAGPAARRLGVFDFTAADARELGYDVSPVWEALRTGWHLVPSQSAWFLHSKKLLARLSEGMDWMSEEERALVARYVPWTRVVEAGKSRWRGKLWDLGELVVEQQESLVLKTATGDAGREVVFGADTAPSVWRDLIAEAVCRGDGVVQEVVPGQTFPVDVMNAAGRVERITADAVISPFCVNGTGSGCHAKLRPAARPGVISISQGAVSTCLVAEA